MTMSQNINIRRDVSDSFYRYKMPRLQSKIEGRGNGIKTLIPNMADIAKALSRPSTYPTKFFGCELGAQVKCDEVNDRYIVNGAHEAAKLQSLLDGFISKFVLCGSCSNPETDLIVTSGRDPEVIRDCKACGQRTPVDMRHKLVTFIVKNPPPIAAYGKKASSAGKQRAKKDGSAAAGGDSAEVSDDDEDDELTRRIHAEAAQLPEGDELSSSLDDWSASVSNEAIAARQQELGGLSDDVARRLNLLDDDDGEDGADDSEALAAYVQDNPKATDAEIVSEIKALGIREDKAVAVLVQVLFSEDVVSQLPKRARLLEKLMNGEKAQKAFLGGVERLVGVSFPALMAKVPIILKMAYDEDLLEEETIVAWSKKASKKYVGKDVSKEIRKKAEPFVQWLLTAEEEDEEESDEEDEEDE